MQPLIRYRLGDSVTMHPDDCPCGNHRPSFTVEGRCDDTLRFPNAAGEVVHLSPMAVTTALEEGADVHRFQLRQTASDALELRLDLSLSADPAALRTASLKALQDYFATQGLPALRLRVSDEAPVVDARSGKLRQVVCEV